MNAYTLEHDDIDWLHEKTQNLIQPDEQFFCKTVTDKLARGWALLDARNYAFGRLMGFQAWRRFKNTWRV